MGERGEIKFTYEQRHSSQVGSWVFLSGIVDWGNLLSEDQLKFNLNIVFYFTIVKCLNYIPLVRLYIYNFLQNLPPTWTYIASKRNNDSWIKKVWSDLWSVLHFQEITQLSMQGVAIRTYASMLRFFYIKKCSFVSVEFICLD